MKFTDFKTFDDKSLALAITEAKEFVNQVEMFPFKHSGYTLTYCGKSGIGKSMLTRIILDELGLDKWGVCARVKRIVQAGHFRNMEAKLFDWRKVSDQFKGGDFSLVEVMEDIELLALDDVGADYDPSKMAASKLDRILRSRKGRWTVVNCNLSVEGMAEQLDPRIASFLIRDGNKVVEIDAKDYSLR